MDVVKQNVLKRIAVSSLVMFGVIFVPKSLYADGRQPQVITKLPEVAFAPLGFDDNDNAQIIVAGYLSDTCHKVGPTRYRVNAREKKIFVRSQQYHYSNCWCADIVTSFSQTIDVGVLNPGDYKVFVEDEKGGFQQMQKLHISESQNDGPDDYLYAPVEEVLVVRELNQPPTIVLRGTFTNSCMYMKDIRTKNSPENVIEILPIADLKRGGCRPERTPFEFQIPLKTNTQGKLLIYVRTLQGSSISKVVDM